MCHKSSLSEPQKVVPRNAIASFDENQNPHPQLSEPPKIAEKNSTLELSKENDRGTYIVTQEIQETLAEEVVPHDDNREALNAAVGVENESTDSQGKWSF